MLIRYQTQVAVTHADENQVGRLLGENKLIQKDIIQVADRQGKPAAPLQKEVIETKGGSTQLNIREKVGEEAVLRQPHAVYLDQHLCLPHPLTQTSHPHLSVTDSN